MVTAFGLYGNTHNEKFGIILRGVPKIFNLLFT